jgi:hypothetical protein
MFVAKIIEGVDIDRMFYECIMVEPLSVRELVAAHTRILWLA